MANAFSAITRFSLNASDFYMYEAADSHGSACVSCLVDGVSVNTEQFGRSIIHTLGLGAAVMLAKQSGLGLKVSEMDDVLGQISISINGTVLSVQVQNERPKWNKPEINGHEVSPAEFRERLKKECEALMRVAHFHFLCLPCPKYQGVVFGASAAA